MPDDVDEIRATLKASGINWHGLPSYKGSRVLNLWREIWNGYRLGKQLIQQHGLNLIHARSFIPGNIGLRLAKKTNAKFLYDMRGFWAAEKWAKGTIKWRWMRRQAQAMENRLFHGADSLISLTDAGKHKLVADGISTPIDVIPCCVDTELFRPQSTIEPNDGGGPRMISVGALGPGYLPESVLGLYRAACDNALAKGYEKQPHLTLLTQTKLTIIEAAAKRVDCSLDNVVIQSAAPEDVVRFLNRADFGLCMIAPSAAKVASSPTKLAEYLACGLPVIANCRQIGDMQAILDQNNIGVALEDQTPAGWQTAIESMLELLKDPSVSARCRQLAVDEFSVDVGVQRYANVYLRLMD